MFERQRDELVGVCIRLADYEDRVIKHVPAEAHAGIKTKIHEVREKCVALLYYISCLKVDDFAMRDLLAEEIREVRRSALAIYWPDQKTQKNDMPAAL